MLILEDEQDMKGATSRKLPSPGTTTVPLSLEDASVGVEASTVCSGVGDSESDDKCRDHRELRLTDSAVPWYSVLSGTGCSRGGASNPCSHSLTRVQAAPVSSSLIPLQRSSNIFPRRGKHGRLQGGGDTTDGRMDTDSQAHLKVGLKARTHFEPLPTHASHP